MAEGKEGIITQIKKKVVSVIEEAISETSTKTIVDIAAVGSFAIGGFLLGLGINIASATWGITGTALIILGIGRLMHNSGAFD